MIRTSESGHWGPGSDIRIMLWRPLLRMSEPRGHTEANVKSTALAGEIDLALNFHPATVRVAGRQVVQILQRAFRRIFSWCCIIHHMTSGVSGSSSAALVFPEVKHGWRFSWR